jgi:hypothetical protein
MLYRTQGPARELPSIDRIMRTPPQVCRAWGHSESLTTQNHKRLVGYKVYVGMHVPAPHEAENKRCLAGAL